MAETETQIIISAKDLTASAFESVNKALEAFRKNTETTAGGMNTLVGVAKGAVAAFGVMYGAEVVGRLVEFHNRVQEQTGALKDQAEGLNLTTDQLQAYIEAFQRSGVDAEQARSILNKFNQTIGEASLGSQGAIDSFKLLGVHILDASGKVRDHNAILAEAAQKLTAMGEGTQRTAISMQLFGRSGGQLRAVLGDLGVGIDELTRRARENGTVIDSETIETFEALNRSSTTLGLQIRALYAEVAAPLQFEAMKELTELTRNLTENFKNAKIGWTDLVMAVMAPGTLFARATAAPEIDQLRGKVAGLTKDIAEQQAIIDKGGGALGAYGVQRATERLGKLNDQLGKTKTLLSAREAAQADANLAKGLAVLPTVTVTGSRDPVARIGGEGSDRIANALQRLEEQRKAIEAASRFLDTSTTASTTELFRSADQMERIGATTASLLKGLDPSSDTAQRIRAAATALEEARTNNVLLREAIEGAAATERQYGDGQAAHTETLKLLNRELATGRLTQDAYTEAVKQANLALLDQQLKAIGAKGGVEGLAAGWSYAAAQYAKQNTDFQKGQQLFNTAKDATKGFFADLNKGIRDGADLWTTFGNAATNALGKISDKLMEMAIDDLFGKAFGGGGGGGGFLSNLFGSGGFDAGSGSSISDIGTNLQIFDGAGFADGGDPPVGVPSLVGERGPELFIPKQAGTILTADRTARALGGGGDTYISVPLTVHMGSFVSKAEQQQQLDMLEMRVTNKIVPTVLAAKKGGGAARQILKS